MLLAIIVRRARLRSSREGASFDESRSRARSAQPWSDSAFRQCHVVACVWEILAAFRPGHAPRPKTKRLVDVNALCSLCVPGCSPDAMPRLRRPIQETRGSLFFRVVQAELHHSTATTCEAWWSIPLAFVVPGYRSEGILLLPSRVSSASLDNPVFACRKRKFLWVHQAENRLWFRLRGVVDFDAERAVQRAREKPIVSPRDRIRA